MTKLKEPLYYFLVRLCNTGLVSLFAGMTSAIAINIFTTPPVSHSGWLTIACLLVAVFALVMLNNIRQAIDGKFAFYLGSGRTEDVAWKLAVDYDNKPRRIRLYALMLVAVAALGTGIGLEYASNSELISAEKELKLKEQRIEGLRADSLRARSSIDSLHVLLRAQPPEKRPKLKG